MEKNNTRIYLKYAVGEIVLVVIGILIALQINNMNEARKERKIERSILQSIHANLIQDDSLINKSLDRYRLTNINIERIFNDKPIPDDSLAYIHTRASGHAEFIPITMAFDRSMSSGSFDLINDTELAEAIQFLYGFTYSSGDRPIKSLDQIGEQTQALNRDFSVFEITSTSRKGLYDKSYVLPFNIENLKKRNANSNLNDLLKMRVLLTSETVLYYNIMLEENRNLRKEISAYLDTL